MNFDAIEGLTNTEINDLFEESVSESTTIACCCTCRDGTYKGDYASGVRCELGGAYYCWVSYNYGSYDAGYKCQQACHYKGGMSQCS